MNFYPFSKGVANFKFIFLCHFSINFERFGAYPAAFMQNFLKHTNFFPFWWISAELWPLFLRSHFFSTHPVVKKNINVKNKIFYVISGGFYVERRKCPGRGEMRGNWKMTAVSCSPQSARLSWCQIFLDEWAGSGSEFRLPIAGRRGRHGRYTRGRR